MICSGQVGVGLKSGPTFPTTFFPWDSIYDLKMYTHFCGPNLPGSYRFQRKRFYVDSTDQLLNNNFCKFYVAQIF